MERMGKSFAYLGFAIKSRKLRTGINAINTLKKDVYLIIVCSAGEKNARKMVAHLFNLHLDYVPKKNPPTKNQQKALQKFENFLNCEGDEK